MCELFSLSSLYPATASISLEEFARHGGISGPHKDGWGIAFYEGKDARVIRDTSSAGSSPYLDFICRRKLTSQIILSHIRLATQGVPALQNCQPFSRELGGRVHLFTHNGDLKDISGAGLRLGHLQPIGETDSEHAFCCLMSMMESLWFSDSPPSLKQRYRVVEQFADQIRSLGPANFIYTDGEYLFVHGHKRTQPGREGFHPPGMHYLKRTCTTPQQNENLSGVELDYNRCDQKVILIASVPLSDEPWQPLGEGELLVFREGEMEKPLAG